MSGDKSSKCSTKSDSTYSKFIDYTQRPLTHPIKRHVKSGCKTVHLGKIPKVFDTCGDKRPPWNDTVLIRDTETRIRTYMRETEVALPQPDYICWPATKYHIKGGKAVKGDEVLLCKENTKLAPWSNPPTEWVKVTYKERTYCGKTTRETKLDDCTYKKVSLNEYKPRLICHRLPCTEMRNIIPGSERGVFGCGSTIVVPKDSNPVKFQLH